MRPAKMARCSGTASRSDAAMVDVGFNPRPSHSRGYPGEEGDDVSDRAGDWRTFDVLPGETASYEITGVLARARTAFQDVEIVETRAFGRALFLDGAPQSAVADEYVY